MATSPGPHVSASRPLGEGGERLHEWMFEGRSEADSVAFENDYFADIGALIIGRRMADVGIGPWGEVPTFHAPCFVVTRRPHETIVKGGGTSYGFVTAGVEAALNQARSAACSRDVLVNGGADVARQYLNAGLLDQVRLHLVPVVLGAGTSPCSTVSGFHGVWPSIGLTPVDVRAEPRVTHLT